MQRVGEACWEYSSSETKMVSHERRLQRFVANERIEVEGCWKGFLQHVLPKGFVKVRYYGLFRVGMRRSLARLRSQLRLLQHIVDQAMPAPAASDGSTRVVICPNCGEPMRLERVVLPHNRGPPGWAD